MIPSYGNQTGQSYKEQSKGVELDAYGSFPLRCKQLEIELDQARISVRYAELEIERHDERVASENERAVARKSNGRDMLAPSRDAIWDASHREELLVRVEEARLQARRVEIAIARNRAREEEGRLNPSVGGIGSQRAYDQADPAADAASAGVI